MKTINKEVKAFTTERLLITIDKALEFAKENKFEMQGTVDAAYKELVADKASKATFTMKKKLNKVISRLEYKLTRKNINLFFNFLNKRLGLNQAIRFLMSKSEAEVVASRKEYRALQLQVEAARLKYKSLKASYYGSGEPDTEYTSKIVF